MKLGKYILGLAVVAAGLTSCDTDNVGAIYDHPAMPNISFTSKTINQETEDEAITIPVTLTRTHSTEAYSTTVNATTSGENIKLQSNTVNFAAGEETATIYVIAENLDWGDRRSCTITLNDADVKTASPFDNPIHEVVVNINKPKLLPAGTCTITDFTWYEEPMVAENVPIINVEGTNKYRIISPLYYLYGKYEEDVDMSNFQFNLLSNGAVTVDDGTPLNYWGYYAYFSSDYSGYCFVSNSGNAYDVNFLLLNGSDLYTGGRFIFVWDKPAE